MSTAAINNHGSANGKFSPEEWQARCDLAACYRLVDHYGWSDLFGTHISLRVPGTDHFLLNPFGLLFGEITASSLVKVDQDGNMLTESEHPINPAGFTIHSAIHMSSHTMNAVLHTHTRAGNAVSCMKEGLLPYHQKALTVLGFVGYHDYESIAIDHDERSRIVKSLGDGNILVLRNHGLLTVGETIGEAFFWMHRMETACQYQVDMLSMNQEIQPPTKDVQDYTIALSKKMFAKGGNLSKNQRWPAMIRKLERECIDDWRQ
jgi:ribulose-5-phosphate 4-epimerase/fuculose-1-phosphate aldolase